MKKIMIMGAVALIGLVSNAATVKWQANAIQSSPDNSVAAGWLVQIYSSSVAFDYANASDGSITAWGSGTTVAAGTTFRASGSVADGLANGTTESFYAVVYDASTVDGAKNYIVSDNVSITATAAGNDVVLSFGAMAGTTVAANKFLNSSWTAVPSESVPEPTSGLLLLLGMAGLALRRKQA